MFADFRDLEERQKIRILGSIGVQREKKDRNKFLLHNQSTRVKKENERMVKREFSNFKIHFIFTKIQKESGSHSLTFRGGYSHVI